MTKKRRTITLDPANDEYLDQAGINASQLINHLVEKEKSEGHQRELLLEAQLADVNADIEDYESQLDRLYERREDIKSDLEDVKERNRKQQELNIKEAAEKLRPKEWYNSIPKEDQIPGPESDEIQALAAQSDMDAKQLRSKVVNHIFESEGDE